MTLFVRIVSALLRYAVLTTSLQDSTHADTRFFPDGDGYPTLDLDIFDTIDQIDAFNRRRERGGRMPSKRDRDNFAWRTCKTFLVEVAAALKALSSRMTVELICGGLEIQKMSSLTMQRVLL